MRLRQCAFNTRMYERQNATRIMCRVNRNVRIKENNRIKKHLMT